MKPKMPLLQIALLALAAPGAAFAALGGDVSSVQADRMHMKASLPMAKQASSYTVHEMQTATGTTVREYATAAGTVFAVAWNGPTVPDLRQLLGNYFDTYSNAARIKHAGHSHFALRQDNLVMRARGHMRAFAGIAYVPGLLPPGMTEEDIK